jgi:hypothetical protein
MGNLPRCGAAPYRDGTKAAGARGASLGWYGSATYTDMVHVTIGRPFFSFIRDIPPARTALSEPSSRRRT